MGLELAQGNPMRPNKPVLPTATNQLADDSLAHSRRQTGESLGVMSIDSPALNESQAQPRERLVLLCRQMLSGELSFFEGAIKVCSLRFMVGVPEFDPDLLAFVAIESETDHLPPRHV